ncbi:Hypothetical predicted protein [Octopus vulgaris]|uniref:Uncharacterized protein n=1 Tax=Octopus vulgaris TaxID=6645 RepID=A0AA36AVL4_OCTVU|nr:Hypothetical predicted protein [Octopus vulgaris]
MAETSVPAASAADAGDISSNVVTINIQGGGHVTFALFNNVGNMKEVRQSVMNGEIEAALLKTSMIHDQFQVLTAAHKALHHRRTKKMITKNIHSEILYCLSPLKGMYKVTADELNIGNLVDAVVCRIAVKEIIAV